MTTSIQDELALLLDAERDRPPAGSETADRVWQGVQARLDGAPPPASVPANTPWGMLSVVGALVVAAGVGGWALSRPGPPAHFDALPPSPALVVAADPGGVPDLHAELPRTGTAPAEAQVVPPTKAAPRQNKGTVADELALIERARTALDGGRAKAALSTLATHRRQFPKGAFLEEAAALRASALCKAGRAEAAQKAADTFRRRYPGSVHSSRVRGC